MPSRVVKPKTGRGGDGGASSPPVRGGLIDWVLALDSDGSADSGLTPWITG